MQQHREGVGKEQRTQLLEEGAGQERAQPQKEGAGQRKEQAEGEGGQPHSEGADLKRGLQEDLKKKQPQTA